MEYIVKYIVKIYVLSNFPSIDTLYLILLLMFGILTYCFLMGSISYTYIMYVTRTITWIPHLNHYIKKNFNRIRTTFVGLLPHCCFCKASNRQRYFSFAACIWTTFINICDSAFARSGARFQPVLLIFVVITSGQICWDCSTCSGLTWRESVCWKWQKWRKVLPSKHFKNWPFN